MSLTFLSLFYFKKERMQLFPDNKSIISKIKTHINDIYSCSWGATDDNAYINT